MDLIERFRYIMKLNKLTASAFADAIGVQASSVSHILSGRNKPSLEFIQKVLRCYPKIDASWLINGTTSQVGEKKISVEKVKEELNEVQQIKEENKVEYQKATPATEHGTSKAIERVVIFFNDGTFKEYKSN